MSFDPKNIAVFGVSGAMGNAFQSILSELYPDAHLHTFSRNSNYKIDYYNEQSILEASKQATKDYPLDLVVVTNGFLHDSKIMPERSLKELSAEKFQHLFFVNTIIPALIAKYFLPKLNQANRSYFAVLSARVGSVSDNKLGGWYAYRASKAALNMIIKNAAIEIRRVNKKATVIGLHPGTVDSNLSKPFQSHIDPNKIFSPEYSVRKLLDVLSKVTLDQSGQCLAWDGKEILP